MKRCGGGLVRCTLPTLFWLRLATLAAPYAGMILAAVWQAHCQQRQRQVKSEEQLINIQRKMTPAEALSVLNFSPALKIPLSEQNLELARQRHQTFFAKAEQCENPYLMGKISEALRVVSRQR